MAGYATSLPMTGRLLAVDVGEKRIGLALSDPAQTVATPLATLTRRPGKRFPLKQLRQYLERVAPVGLVVGLPLTSAGDEDAWTRAVRATGEHLADKTGLPVTYWDERMTTARVVSAVREQGGGMRGRKPDVDPLAATVLLQAYLESRRRGT